MTTIPGRPAEHVEHEVKRLPLDAQFPLECCRCELQASFGLLSHIPQLVMLSATFAGGLLI